MKMESLTALCFITAMLMTMAGSSTIPVMTTSDDTEPQFATSPASLTVLDLKWNTLDNAMASSYLLCNVALEQALHLARVSGITLSLNHFANKSPRPKLSETVVDDANICQNLPAVLSNISEVLSQFKEMVEGISNRQVDSSDISNKIQSVLVKVHRMLRADGEPTYPPPPSVNPDVFNILQTLVALKDETVSMIDIFRSVTKCPY